MSGFHPDYYLGSSCRGREEEKYYRMLRLIGMLFLDEVLEVNGNLPTAFIHAKTDDFKTKIMQFSEQLTGNHTIERCVEALMSTSVCRLALVLEKFRTDPTSRIYRAPKGFCEALLTVPIAIHDDIFPREFSSFIEFPKPVVFTDCSEPIIGVYAHVEEIKEDWTWSVSDEKRRFKSGDLLVDILAVSPARAVPTSCVEVLGSRPTREEQKILNKILGGDTRQPYTFDLVPVISFSITSGSSNNNLDDEFGSGNSAQLIKLVLNLIMYIHSLEPDIQHLKPASEYNSKEKRHLYQEGVPLVSSAYPVTLVSWHYGADRTYHIDQSTVRGHHKWQRCGEGLSKTKLIYIDEHDRHYQTKET